jgi:hypothetical protein
MERIKKENEIRKIKKILTLKIKEEIDKIKINIKNSS